MRACDVGERLECDVVDDLEEEEEEIDVEETEEDMDGEGDTSRVFPFCLFFDGVRAGGDSATDTEEALPGRPGDDSVADDVEDGGRGGGLATGLTDDFNFASRPPCTAPPFCVMLLSSPSSPIADH